MALSIPMYILAQGIYSGIITGISTMTLGTCRLVGTIYSHKNPNITERLKQLDIEYHLNLINAILKQNQKITNISKITIESQTFEIVDYNPNIKSDDPIKISLSYISKAIEDIHSDLLDINRVVLYHKTKYFNSWRSMGVSKYLKILENDIKILENRFNDFIKICQIKN